MLLALSNSLTSLTLDFKKGRGIIQNKFPIALWSTMMRNSIRNSATGVGHRLISFKLLYIIPLGPISKNRG